MARDKHDAQIVLESYQLPTAHTFNELISLGTKGVWILSSAISDIGFGAILNQENFVQAAWAQAIENMKTGCLRTALDAPIEMKEVISVRVPIEQVYKKTWFFINTRSKNEHQ